MSRCCEQFNIKLGLLFSKLGLPPNLWTVLSLIPALGGFAALYYHNLFAALILFVFSGVIDAIDGAVARVTNSVSNLGAFLNGVIESYVEIFFYIGLFFYIQGSVDFIIPNSLWVLLLVFGSIMPTFIKAYADHKKVITDAESHKRMEGVFGRTGRLIMTYIGMFLGCYDIKWLIYVIALTALLSNLAAIQRVIYVVKKRYQQI